VTGYRRVTTRGIAPSLDDEQVDVSFDEHTIATYRRGVDHRSCWSTR
jgi:hypothetical protein